MIGCVGFRFVEGVGGYFCMGNGVSRSRSVEVVDSMERGRGKVRLRDVSGGGRGGVEVGWDGCGC